MCATDPIGPSDPDPEIGTKVLVVPCSAVDAFAWAAGKATDLDLLTKPCLAPEAVFVVTLPSRQHYREMLQLVNHWRERGAVCLIARTGNPVVDKHLSEKNGSLRAFQDPDGKYRFVAPPEVFQRWCARCRMKSLTPCCKRAS